MERQKRVSTPRDKVYTVKITYSGKKYIRYLSL